jgi:hypothetical protein
MRACVLDDYCGLIASLAGVGCLHPRTEQLRALEGDRGHLLQYKLGAGGLSNSTPTGPDTARVARFP